MADIRLSARTTLTSLSRWVETISGNLTGAQVQGYRGTRLSFGDSLVTTIRDGAGSATAGGTGAIQVPSGGIGLGSTSTDFRQGAITGTSSTTAAAISGSGWFAVAGPGGSISYTRNGDFRVSDDGSLVTSDGQFVLGVFDQTRGLVIDNGTSFRVPGAQPATVGGTGLVSIGGKGAAAMIPTGGTTSGNLTVYGRTIALGNIDTIAGGGAGGSGALATAAAMGSVWGLKVDPQNNLIISDGGSNVVRMVPAVNGTFFGQAMLANHMYVIAGGGAGGDGSVPTAASLPVPAATAMDPAGNLFIVEGGNGRVRMVPATGGTYFGQVMTAGRIYTIAGAGGAGFSGDNGPALAALMNNPRGLTVDATGNVYVADFFNGRVRMIPAVSGTYYGQAMIAGNIYSVVAGGCCDVMIDSAGNLLVADQGNSRVRMLPVASGTYYGQALTAGVIGTVASGVAASRLDLDPYGNIVIELNGSNQVKVVAAATQTEYGQSMTLGGIYTIAGTGAAGATGDGGPATAATFSSPLGLTVDRNGNVLVGSGTRVRAVAAMPPTQPSNLYTLLDQPAAGSQDRMVATRYVGAGQVLVGGLRQGTGLPLCTIITVDGTIVPIPIDLSGTTNTKANTAYANACLIATAINAQSAKTGIGCGIVRDRSDPDGQVALVLSQVHRTISETFIDFTAPLDPSADLLIRQAGVMAYTTDSQANVYYDLNVRGLFAGAPQYQPQPGDRISIDATGQVINQSRGATPGSAPPLATGMHLAMTDFANPDGLTRTRGGTLFQHGESAGTIAAGFAGQEGDTQIDRTIGMQQVGRSTIGRQNQLLPQSLEGSNTSITDSLPELTIAQKFFSSNTKLISVGNSIIDDLDGLIR